MTQLVPEIEFTVLEDHEFDIPCDYGEKGHDGWPTPHGPAEWVVGVGATCSHPKDRLLCTSCKDFIITSPEALRCTNCNFMNVPMRRTVRFIEPLGTQ